MLVTGRVNSSLELNTGDPVAGPPPDISAEPLSAPALLLGLLLAVDTSATSVQLVPFHVSVTANALVLGFVPDAQTADV